MKGFLTHITHSLASMLDGEFVKYTIGEQEALQHDPSLTYQRLIELTALERSLSGAAYTELHELLKCIQKISTPGPIIEFGTLLGRVTGVIACVKDTQRELLTIDNYSWNPFGFAADQQYRLTEKLLAELVESMKTKLLWMERKSFYSIYDGGAPALVVINADSCLEEIGSTIEWAQQVGASQICGFGYDTERNPAFVHAIDQHGAPIDVTGTFWVLS